MQNGCPAPTDAADPVSIPDLPHDFDAYLARKVDTDAASRGATNADSGQEQTATALIRDVERISRTLQRFAQAVSDAMENPREAHEFLRKLDIRSVSRDHDWRRIFSELTERDLCFDGHKRTLLIRYLQYLSERKRLLDYVRAEQLGLTETIERPATPDDLSQSARLLGAGETVVCTEFDEPIELRLGRHLFHLVQEADGGLTVRGPSGFHHALGLGRNLIGRHPECDIKVDGAHRDVSRVHVLVDWVRESGGESNEPAPTYLRITALSGAGTRVREGTL